MSKNTNLSFLTDYITADITNGRIGINNASPTVAFDVSGATKINGALTLTSTISNGTYTYTLPSATGTLALTSAISGTTNYVPKFTSSSAIGNSSIQDSGTALTFGVESTFNGNVIISKGSPHVNLYATTGTAGQYNIGNSSGTTHWAMYSIIGGGGSQGNWGLYSLGKTGGAGSVIEVTSAGNVGIGTSSPGNKLSILGADETSNPTLGTNAGKFGIFNGVGAGTYGMIMGVINNGNSYLQVQRIDATATAYNLLLQPSGGSVGIGIATANPTYNLQINSSGTSSIIHLTNSTTGAVTSDGGLLLQSGLDMTFTNREAGRMSFETSNTERMRITSGGDVGIGTTSPSVLLHAKTTGDGYNMLTIESTSGDAGIALKGGTGGTSVGGFTIQGQNGGSMVFVDRNSTPATRMTISSNGSIGAPSGTNIYNASDVRLKKNISTTTYGLDIISALNPVKFNWVDGFEPSEDGKDMLGFVAQEVQTVLPEAIESFGANSITIGDTIIDNPLRVNEKFLIPVLVKAIQELRVEIETLKQK